MYLSGHWIRKWRRLHDIWVTLLDVTCLEITQDGNTLFVGIGNEELNSGLYMTSDYGANWTHLGTSIGGIVGMYSSGEIYPLEVESFTLASDNILYAGTPKGVWTNAPINIQPTPPSSRITTPINGAAIKGTTSAITGTASANCPNFVRRVEISINDGPWSPATGTPNQDYPWNYTWSLPSDGSYKIKSRATDNAGNQETTSLGILVTVDNTKPVSNISEVTWRTINGVRYLLIFGTATDGTGSGVARVQVGFAGSSRGGIRLTPEVAIPKSKDKPIWMDARGTFNWHYRVILPSTFMTSITGVKFRIKSRATDRASNIEIPGAGKIVTIP